MPADDAQRLAMGVRLPLRTLEHFLFYLAKLQTTPDYCEAMAESLESLAATIRCYTAGDIVADPESQWDQLPGGT